MIESACNAGDLGSVLGSGRSPGERNGNPFQFSRQENITDRRTWQATVREVSKSWILVYQPGIKPRPPAGSPGNSLKL